MLTVDELLDRAIDHARTVLVGKPEAELMPTWLIQEKDQTTIVGTPWRGDDEKTMIIFAMRMSLRDKRAHSYSFMSEAWMATESLQTIRLA